MSIAVKAKDRRSAWGRSRLRPRCLSTAVIPIWLRPSTTTRNKPRSQISQGMSAVGPPDVVATSNPFHNLLSPTTRRSILLIRSERSTSAALMAAIVCRKVLTFDPSDTIPPSTTAIDPTAAT